MNTNHWFAHARRRLNEWAALSILALLTVITLPLSCLWIATSLGREWRFAAQMRKRREG